MEKSFRNFLFVLSAGTVFFAAVVRPLSFQWDLLVFYRAGLAWRHGLNPYDFSELVRAGLIEAPREILTFTYLPIFAAIFSPLSLLSFPAAAAAWMMGKGAALWLFFRSCRPFHAFRKDSLWDVAILFFGFNSALFSDLLSGNASLVLIALLWAAIDWFLRGKFYRSAFLIGAVASVKMLPAALLVIFVLPKPRWRPALAGTAVFAGIFAANAALWPEMFSSFLAEARYRAALETGILAPSLFALSSDLLSQWQNVSVVPEAWKAIPSWLPWSLYGTLALPVAAITGFRLRDRWDAPSPVRAVSLILLAWVLLVPRLKSYDFVLLLPVAAWVISGCGGARRTALLVLVLLPVVFPIVQRPVEIYSVAHLGVVKKAMVLTLQYLPWFACLALWWSVVERRHAESGVKAAGAASSATEAPS